MARREHIWRTGCGIGLGGVLLALAGAATLALTGRQAHPEFGAISVASVLEDRSDLRAWLADARARVFRDPDVASGGRYANLGGIPAELGVARQERAFVYLHHPESGQPCWEIAWCNRGGLPELTLEDLTNRFHGMGDPAGTAVFGDGWKGHAVVVPQGSVVLLRPVTNRTKVYAVLVAKVNRAKGARRVDVQYLLVPAPEER